MFNLRLKIENINAIRYCITVISGDLLTNETSLTFISLPHRTPAVLTTEHFYQCIGFSSAPFSVAYRKFFSKGVRFDCL